MEVPGIGPAVLEGLRDLGVLLGIMLVASTALFGGGRWALLALLVALWLYALLSGMAPPVVRAAIMGSLYLGSRLTGRQSAGFPALALAAGVMVGLKPGLLEEVSFQLSFAAMASLILLTSGIAVRLGALTARLVAGPAHLPGAAQRLNAALAVGVAATIGTMPLIAFAFHRVSLVGIPMTLLALPALPVMLVGSGVTAVLGLLAGWATWVPVTYLLGLVRLVDALPGIAVDVGPGAPLAVGGFYGALLLLIARRPLRRGLAALAANGRPALA